MGEMEWVDSEKRLASYSAAAELTGLIPQREEFVDWYERFEDLIEDDFSAVHPEEFILIKDWLSQAFQAGRR